MRLLLVLVLLLTAAGLGLVAWQVVQLAVPTPVASAVAPPPAPTRIRVLTAARSLLAGSLLKEGDWEVREVLPDTVSDETLRDTREERAELQGAMLRQYREAGAPLSRADVLHPRDRGFLAAVLRPGQRAISVGVDAVTGAAGLIWPGDQVDLILTQELDSSQAPLDRRVVAETVLTDIRVIAVDQKMAQGASAESATRDVASTVTLQVSAREAERVAVASRLGRLSVTVRAMEETVAAEPAAERTAVFGADVSSALSQNEQGTVTRMRVIQGGEAQDLTFR
ncbi:Flp pilus assembly protein CpaB [Pseudoroseomonas wenyumeiae]|uniref:Flp pilus assembly protein CpaB n=1 Tax=Teichococcus wenyumeiae TaxID=2478470 RepID=A0A3A9JET0_9PROT|nr:Flp pilus assembly protein CpaB [Pseudoroseomonas wenyumeiae]RKK03193.1 Flp pilus assembly protein CpaB [Pseudoroseomonas wenyumeiae]RMI15550.1 Flp pilus assembly protein CpaB [Pseudoroseomonas wenyumeiae]